jgi:FeS assembly SUF system protein
MKTLPMIPDVPAQPAATSGDTTTMVADAARTEALKPAILEAIQTVYDPEIPVNIWELGLIYDVIVDAGNVAGVRMTLTAPGCPAAQSLPGEVAEKVKAVPGVADAKVDVVWEPAWTKDRMSEVAKLQLGMW